MRVFSEWSYAMHWYGGYGSVVVRCGAYVGKRWLPPSVSGPQPRRDCGGSRACPGDCGERTKKRWMRLLRSRAPFQDQQDREGGSFTSRCKLALGGYYLTKDLQQQLRDGLDLPQGAEVRPRGDTGGARRAACGSWLAHVWFRATPNRFVVLYRWFQLFRTRVQGTLGTFRGNSCFKWCSRTTNFSIRWNVEVRNDTGEH